VEIFKTANHVTARCVLVSSQGNIRQMLHNFTLI